MVSHEGFRFDLRVVPPECYGNLLQHFTGSKEHNVALREEAVRRGLSVSEYGVTEVESGEVLHGRDRGGAVRVARLRSSSRRSCARTRGELEAARNGELPELVEAGDLRGDLHTHTTWSADGKNTIEEMARAAKARGYAYYAITDHSHYLRDGKLDAQAKEIDALERAGGAVPAPARASRSTSGPTARWTSPTRTLADAATGSSRRSTPRFETNPTERVLAAMENPHVRLHRPPDRPQDQQARADATSTSSA